MIRARYLAATLAAATIGLNASAMAASAPVPPELGMQVAPAAEGFDAVRLERLHAFMADVVAQGRVAGMTTLLARHGKVVAFNTYGKADLATGRSMDGDAIFRIYSMSKPITGVAMMILYEEGKWRLDDPVTRFVPEFKDLRVAIGTDRNGGIITEPMKRPPTLREIMSHTAGFGYGLGDKTAVDRLYREKRVLGSTGLKQMIDRTAEIPLLFQPGTQWSYSSAVDIQGYIVEKITGQSLGEFLEQQVFKPLKMNDTAFYVHPGKEARLAKVYAGDPKTNKIDEVKNIFSYDLPNYTKPPLMESGGGGLTSSTADYARFCQMILNKGELDGARILSPATVELMGVNVIPHDVLVSSNGTVSAGFNKSVGFGLDFMVVNDPKGAGSPVGKGTLSWGGAAGTWFWIDPANDLYFVGMIQRMGGTGGDDLGGQARTLTYQALTHPEK